MDKVLKVGTVSAGFVANFHAGKLKQDRSIKFVSVTCPGSLYDDLEFAIEII